MRHGVFLMPVHNPDKPLAQCIDEDLEMVVRSEELGFDEFWVGEHHTSRLENIVMPEIFIAKALALTKTIRMGPAPVCLQYHHPVDVANRLAFLDHLSHGRLNVCFGPGAVPSDLELHGVQPQDSGAMVGEALDMILRTWCSDPPYEMEGKFWRTTLKQCLSPELGTGYLCRPYQKPHPPIAAPSINRNSAGLRMAGARGFWPISHHMCSVGTVANHWETYAQGAVEAGRTPDRNNWRVSRNIFVADSGDAARRTARENSLGKCIQYILDLTRRFGNIAMWKRDPEMDDDAVNLDYFMKEVVIAGDPDEVVQQLRALREQVGDFGVLIFTAHDWDDREAWLRCLELFAREVMPRVG